MTVSAPDGIDTLVTTAEAAHVAGVTTATIRSWKQRGILTPSGLDPNGHNLYRIRDVARAERSTRNRTWRVA